MYIPVNVPLLARGQFSTADLIITWSTLKPLYIPAVQRQPVTTIMVRRWSIKKKSGGGLEGNLQEANELNLAPQNATGGPSHLLPSNFITPPLMQGGSLTHGSENSNTNNAQYFDW